MVEPDLPEQWIQAHLEGRLSPAETKDFHAWLQADREHRRRFMRSVRHHEELILVTTERVRQRSTTEEVSISGVGRSARLRRAAHRRWTWRPKAASAALLAVAAMLLVSLALFGRTFMERALPMPGAEVFLAAGGARSVDGVPWAAGDRIALGRRLTMTSPGQLRWQDGSQLTVKAGALVECRAAGVNVEHGEVTASIQPHAKDNPFVITTPQATVTVVGTRFDVVVDQGETAVAVTSGHVRVVSRTGEEKILGEGESLRVGPQGLHARTLTVAAVGSTGPQGTHPTIAAAISAARPGDTVLLLAGQHVFPPTLANQQNAVVIDKSGTAESPIVFRGQQGAELIVDSWTGIRVVGASWVEIRSLRLRYQGTGRSGGSGNGLIIERSRHVTVADCEILDFGGNGLGTWDSSGLLIQGNLIDHCGGGPVGASNGITIGNPQNPDSSTDYQVRIIGNRIFRTELRSPNRTTGNWTEGNGIWVMGGVNPTSSPRVLIANNTISGSGGWGITSLRLNNVEIHGNLLHWSGRQPLHPGGEMNLFGQGLVVDGNLVIPADGRMAWTNTEKMRAKLRRNFVWEGDGVPRTEVRNEERLSRSPFTTMVPSEELRQDFTLQPGMTFGAP